MSGTGHAIEHFQKTGHCLVVKVASIQEVSVAPAFYNRITQMCIATRATTIPITITAICYCPPFTPFSPRPIDRKTEAEAVEANDHEGDVRGRGLHAEASKVRALRASHWTSIQESARYSPRIEDNVLPGHYRSEEEPAEQIVHRAGSDHEGNDHRGECERVGIGDRVGKGRVG